MEFIIPAGTVKHQKREPLDPEIDDRATIHFLRAVSGTLPPRMGRVLRLPDVEARRPDLERAARLTSDAALSADEAARYEHRQRVVAPLLMLLALGLLFAAGWSC